jgi:hypothetical protein
MSPQDAYKKFRDYSQGIAASFLQTVIVVDDKTEIAPKEKESIAKKDATIIVPGRKSVVKIDPILEDDEALPIKVLNEAFAQRGIVCGFLNPSNTGSDRETIIQAAEKAAKRADIVVLDWKMEGNDAEKKDGFTAKRIISEILKNDTQGNDFFQSKGRLRLIAIYSQTPNLADIIDNIETTLNTGTAIDQQFKKENDFTLVHESTRICAFRKSGGTTKLDRTYNVKELTGILIEEFSLLTEGLLSNVAIGALSALRLNTHKILQKFNPKLDAAYLTHRALSNPVEETQSHPIALLASEMHDVLEGNDIVSSVSTEQIKLWIESLPARMTMQSTISRITPEQLPEFLVDVVTNGVHKDTDLSQTSQNWKSFIDSYRGPQSKDSSSKITNLMLPDSSGNIRDKEFSILTTIRSHYNEPAPYLTMGSVIAIRTDVGSKYLFCAQPVCDCVRIKNARKFPFLKLEHKTGKFDFVINDNNKYVELKVNLKPYEVETITFSPLEGFIKAEKVGNEWVFRGTDATGNAVECFWIADLKFAHAQRVAERFGGEMSRVGLTESEWLRRMAS